ncbi:hypothetical protein E2C01_090891 [Portunus trituberculatus]|uniref:Uncharacterized protein n=1 Tax=Portunus trituberculatus TaxID=210409 RepID=A0A5B7JCK5_PORTR|nr:hypothetical protein [Portunus trituberculatus]
MNDSIHVFTNTLKADTRDTSYSHTPGVLLKLTCGKPERRYTCRARLRKGQDSPPAPTFSPLTSPLTLHNRHHHHYPDRHLHRHRCRHERHCRTSTKVMANFPKHNTISRLAALPSVVNRSGEATRMTWFHIALCFLPHLSSR